MNNLILTNPNRKMEQAMERIGQFGGAAMVLSDSQDVGCLNPCKSLDILEFTEEDTTSRLNPWCCPDFYIYCFNEWAKDISGLFCQAYGLPKSCWKVLENAILAIGKPDRTTFETIRDQVALQADLADNRYLFVMRSLESVLEDPVLYRIFCCKPEQDQSPLVFHSCLRYLENSYDLGLVQVKIHEKIDQKAKRFLQGVLAHFGGLYGGMKNILIDKADTGYFADRFFYGTAGMMSHSPFEKIVLNAIHFNKQLLLLCEDPEALPGFVQKYSYHLC